MPNRKNNPWPSGIFYLFIFTLPILVILIISYLCQKFYMKVNIYDDENIQKGRMMLLNIAEDLKSDCRIAVSPVQQEKKQDQIVKKKDSKLLKPEEIEKAALESKKKRDDLVAIQHEDEDDKLSDAEDQPEYLYMELKSTASFITSEPPNPLKLGTGFILVTFCL